MKETISSSEYNKRDAYKFGCVIMASGMGVRFGGNKLMADFGPKPMIQWILDATDGLFEERVVVTRQKSVEELCRKQGVKVIFHEYPYRSDTVRLGIQSMPLQISNCMFCTGDQPLIRRETIQRLLLEGKKHPEAIIRTSYQEQVGSPVLFPKWTFEELAMLPQGKGGAVLIRKYKEEVRSVQAGTQEELLDIDTPKMLEALWQQYIVNHKLK